IVSGEVGEIMRQMAGGQLYEVRLPPEDRPAALQLLAGRSDVADAHEAEGGIDVSYCGAPEEVHHLLAALVNGGARVQAFSPQRTDLEDIFLRVTRGVVS